MKSVSSFGLDLLILRDRLRRADSREELKAELILLCKKEVSVSVQDAFLDDSLCRSFGQNRPRMQWRDFDPFGWPGWALGLPQRSWWKWWWRWASEPKVSSKNLKFWVGTVKNELNIFCGLVHFRAVPFPRASLYFRMWHLFTLLVSPPHSSLSLFRLQPPGQLSKVHRLHTDLSWCKSGR